jgi:hypothetical protein
VRLTSENIIKGGDREISKKKKERAVEINNVELAKDEAIKAISASHSSNLILLFFKCCSL